MQPQPSSEPLLEIHRSPTDTYQIDREERDKLEALPEPVRQNIETMVWG